MKINEAVKELRAKLGWSLQKFATAIDVSMTSVVKYEAGRNPTGRVLVNLTRLANENNYRDLAAIFHRAFCEEMGIRDWN